MFIGKKTMKKLLSLLTILFFSTRVHAEIGFGTAVFNIVGGLSISEIQAANFGTIITNGYSGVVVLGENGGVTLCFEAGASNFTLLGGCVAPAFKVTGMPGQNVYLSSTLGGGTTPLIGPSGSEPILFGFLQTNGSMVIIASSDGWYETIGVNGEAILYPIVALIINENQMPGVYSGMYPITVNYE